MNSLASWAVRQWQFTLVLFTLLMALGINAFSNIPRSEDPHFPISIFIVRAVLPGADPADIERLIADPLEDILDDLDDVKSIESTSADGVGVVSVEFEWDTDADQKYDEVVREVNAVRPDLPEAIVELEVERVRTTRAAIAQIALVSDTASWRTFEDVADRLKDRLDRVPDVWEAEYWGIPEIEIRVSLDPNRLAELGLPATQVADALRAEGIDVPSGAVHVGGRRFNVTATGSFDTLEEIGDVLLREVDGQTVRVRDVAEIAWEAGEAKHLTWANGKRAVFVTVKQKDNMNVFDVRDGVWKALDSFEDQLPPDIKMVRYFDQSVSVSHRLDTLLRDFSIALGLVLITLLPLGLRASVVVMISIPLSLAMGVIALQATGFSLNQLSISGAILALGLLVDDTIVVTENIERHLRMGLKRKEAAILATEQITPAVLGATAVLLLAFVPLLFLPEGAGKFTRSLPVTVLYTVAASLFVSLTIIPFLASRMLSEKENTRGNIAMRIVMGAIHTIYRPILHVALQVPRLTLALAFVGFIVTLPIVSLLGFTLFPPADSRQFVVDIDTPEGSALSKTGEALDRVEEILAAEPEVNWYLSNLGNGNPQIYYNVIPKRNLPNHASVFVSLKEWKRFEGPAIIDRLRASFDAIPGAKVTVRIFENGPPIDAPIAIRVTGPEIGVLKDLAAKVTAIVETTPGTRDINNPVRIDRTDITLGIDTGKSGLLGIPAGAIDRTLRLSLEGEEVARFRDVEGDDFPVKIRLPLDTRHELDALGQIYVPTSSGAGVPLSLIGAPAFESGPTQIDRFNRERTVTITSFLETGAVVSKVTQEVESRLADLDIPVGYSLSTGGTAEALTSSLLGLQNAALIALFGIMMVLILEFRSFAVTAVVAGVIPLGVMGGLIALFVTGYSLSFVALIGFIALIGIEIKSSILLVDFTNQLRREGVPLREAIERAGEIRFLPVLLTSVTAIGGLLPLALEGSGLFSPLALVIIGGLITSTLLSRVVTPVMYYLLAPRQIGDLKALGD